MRRWLAAGVLCIGVLVGGCTGRGGTAPARPPLPLAAPKDMAEGAATPFRPAVDEYMEVRRQAVIQGDVNILWQAYPALKAPADRQAGINVEADTVNSYRRLPPFDGKLLAESYAPLMARVDGDKAVVLVNGSEVYSGRDGAESGGQIQILLYLERAGDRWTVVRTDETTLAEYHRALK